MKTRISILIFISVCLLGLSPASRDNDTFQLQGQNTRWADSVMKTLSPDERIAQLFMVAAYSNKEKDHVASIDTLIKKYRIGGLIFFQGGPVRQAILTNHYQSISRVPLLVSIDGEWGLAMRLDSTVQYPRQMSLGAMANDSLIYTMGKEIARQCKRLGIHVNLAPVADVNNNPLNPVISNRSFGENKYKVAAKAIMYMKGMQDAGVLANAKHFPGHGDTDSDSHKTLPSITSSKERMDSLELYPFKQLIANGLGSMMVAHLFIPAYDTTPKTASTLSKAVVTGLLKEQLGFNGLVFTDALNMKGVSKYFEAGVVDVKALLAGNDVLLFPEDVPVGIAAIKKAIANKEISQEEVDARCRKILIAKSWAGLNNYKPIELKNLVEDLNTPQANLINRKLVEASLTVLRNRNDLLPLRRLDTLKIASLSLGYKDVPCRFQSMLSNYAPVAHYGIDRDASRAEADTVLKKLSAYNLVIVGINNTNNVPKKDFGITAGSVRVLKELIRRKKVIVDVFANPYSLAKLDSIAAADALIMSYEDNDLTEELSAQLIGGGICANGVLPVSVGTDLRAGEGIITAAPMRFNYTLPEDIGIDSRKLQRIDSIALAGITEKCYPGCQVLVAKSGKVIYSKSFGYHTYENKIRVKDDDLYDIASITKITASLPSLMTLMDKKQLSIDSTLGYYLPMAKGSNKEKIIIREMLTHQAGLRSWIPFWMSTVVKGEYVKGIYSTTRSDSFPTRVAEKLYIKKGYSDTIYKRIIASKMADEHKYVYSDLGYYMLQKVIEQKTAMPLEQYTKETFFRPMGLSTMTYRPRERFPLKRIVPTEYDVKFRKQLVHGDVHDQGAAMLGGIAGHAGLFSNANDLAIFMQMYLQRGEYGGQRFIDTATVGECVKCQYCKDNRRGVGFDKPETDPKKDSPVCSCVSYLSFGHSGFTGTLAWADPENQLVYIFLSNRVYPDPEINKLVKSGIRSKIQEVIYDAVK